MPYKNKEDERKYYLEHKEQYKTNQLKHYQAHKELCLKRYHNQNKKRWLMKVEILTHYSNGLGFACKICGESDIRALCLDHINGNGASQRRTLHKHGGWEFYAWLKAQGYPEGYQVLCWNCNWKKRCVEYNLYMEVN